MSDTLTIRIPADMNEAIEVVGDVVPDRLPPIYCAGADRDNPDDFCLAFYAEQGSNSVQENYRASLMAEISSPDEPSTVMGDVLMVADAALCQRVVENDQGFQVHKRSVQAFRAWLRDYSEANNLDVGQVFDAVHSYATHVYDESQATIEKEQVERIANMLGLDPSQVGVIHL